MVARAIFGALPVFILTANCAVIQHRGLCQRLPHCQQLGRVGWPVLTLSAQELHHAVWPTVRCKKQLLRTWVKGRTALSERSTAASFPVAFAAAFWSWPARPAFAAATAATNTVATWPLKGPFLRRALRLVAAVCFAWYALSVKSAGPSANPERRSAVPINCPWPFVLVAIPWTPLGMRSIKAGLCDWQTWAVVALVFLRSALI